ncbi:hypothetical protein B566_EDAN006331, partial [Ephemera danica]
MAAEPDGTFFQDLKSTCSAELYLLKHGENLYCATDDEDTPALAWNHNLDMEDEPLESVYWSKPAPYSTINCKPEFRKRQCGGWNTTGWRTVHSYERDLPPVRFVVNRGNNTRSHLFQQSVTELHFPVSLLLRDNAFIVLGNHEDNILEPLSNTQPMSLRFVASVETQLCISITYIAKYTFPKNSEAYVQLSNYQVEVKRELLPLGKEWKTVKQVFDVTPEFRVSKIKSDAANECTDLKKNKVMSLKPVNAFIQNHDFSRMNYTPNYNLLLSEILSNVQECRDVIVCTSTACTCAPGFQGRNCEEGYLGIGVHVPKPSSYKIFCRSYLIFLSLFTDCPAGKHGYMCSERCRVICKNQKCDHVTGECTDGCDNGWQGTNCSIPECEDGRYGKNCSMLCSDNCMEYCNKDNGSCVQGCKPGWKGDTCNSECDVGSYGIGCRKKCNGKCKNDETCNAVNGHCFNGCEDGFTGEKCDLQPLSTLSIILISVGVLAFVLLGIGLIYSLVWILRLRLKLYKSLELHKNPAPPIGSLQQQARQEVLGADVVFYDEITENKTKRDKEQSSSLDINLVSNSVIYDIPGKYVPSTSKRSLDLEDKDGYLNAISAKAGSSKQKGIPILPGDMGSPYADVLNLSDNQTVAEYEYIRHEDAELYLLKHRENLYCATDDEDTPALAWNHNLYKENEPLELIYWSTPAPYSAINCKLGFEKQHCRGWNTTDLKRSVINRDYVLEPSSYTQPMTLTFVASEGNQLCISITYIAPHTYTQKEKAYVQLSNYEEETTGKEWKTVKQVFDVTPEIRVSKIKSDAANECTELKKNQTVSLKSVNIYNPSQDFSRAILTPNYNLLFPEILPNVQDYRD